MNINFISIYKGIKTAAKLYSAYRDYKALRKLGYKSKDALELAAMQAGTSLLDLFDHVKKKSGDFGDMNISDLAELTSNDLANTVYSTQKTF